MEYGPSNPAVTAAQLALKQDKALTVVESAAASVSPTAADSGKYYRLSNGSPTFNLPTTGLVVGETEFWLTFSVANGIVDAGLGKTVDSLTFDSSNFTGAAAQTATNCYPFRLYHIKYVATNTWASDLLGTP